MQIRKKKVEDEDMKENKKWMLASALLLVIGITAIGTKWCVVADRTEDVGKTEMGAEIDKDVMDGAEEIRNLSDTIDEVYDEAQALIVEKVVRTQIEQEDGSIETQYDSYVQSHINLAEGSDVTTDYTQASVGESIELEDAVNVGFPDVFGFDYRGKMGGEIYKAFLLDAGIDGSLEQANLDETTYEMTGQKIYVLESECAVINTLLQDVEYDELLGTEVSYQMESIPTEDETEKNMVPEFYTAMVQYELDGQFITKNLFLQISMSNEE